MKKKKFKISEKDMKALFLLLTIAVIAAAYFLSWQPNMKKSEAIQADIDTMVKRLDTLKNMKAMEEETKKQTEQYNKSVEAMLNLFPPDVRTEDCVMLVDRMEEECGMQVRSESFTDNEVFYPTNLNGAAPTANEEGQEAVSGSSLTLTGYKRTVTITYHTTYEGIKKVLDFIFKNSKDRMTVDKVSVSYDSGTGELSGNMEISLYSLELPQEEEKEGEEEIYTRTYEPPTVESNGYGTENIFGTSNRILKSGAQ